MSEETYLYDSVYASYDGFHIKLRTQRDTGDHVVYLEPRLWDALKDWLCGFRC